MSENKYVHAMCFALLISLAVYGWYCVSRGSIHSDGTGATATRNKLGEVESHQQSAAAANKRAEELNQSSQIRLDGASQNIDRMQTGIESSAELIGECQQIISRVRERGKVEIKKD